MSAPAVAGAAPRLASPAALRRFLLPSIPDCLFVATIVWMFMLTGNGWSQLLLDGDCGWHIRTGEYILDHGAVPANDLFSFSKPGAPWYAWEWGSDVLYAALHRALGLKGIVLFAGAQIALFATILVRFMIWRGANTLIAIPLALLAMGACSMHYLARPHLFTLILVPVTVWIVERDLRQPGPWVWILIPLTAAWTNLHGGFLAGIACLGLFSAGTAMEAWWRRGGWSRPLRYGLLTALCSAATLANPYGYRLHQHIAGYLSSDWIRQAVQEFQSPSFRGENLMQFEILLLLGLMAAAAALRRGGFCHALLILFWANQALGSVRHATIFVSLATPVVAVEATMIWRSWVEGAGRKSVRAILDAMASDMAPNFRWISAWPVVFVTGLLLWEDTSRWPRDFPDTHFPVKIVAKHKDLLIRGRVLSTDQWGDYLIYRHYPAQKVFIDGRSDFYGPVLGKQYLNLAGGRYDWERILSEHNFDAALIPASWALGSLLKRSVDWRLVEDDGKALLFVITSRPMTGKVPKKAGEALLKTPPPSEFSMGDLTDMKQGKSATLRPVPRRLEPSGTQETQGNWRLPSGQPLAEFAINGGFVAPGLLRRFPASQAPSAPTGRPKPEASQEKASKPQVPPEERTA